MHLTSPYVVSLFVYLDCCKHFEINECHLPCDFFRVEVEETDDVADFFRELWIEWRMLEVVVVCGVGGG